MSSPLDWNAKTIAEFRANQGRVGGVFEGAPIVLAHHRGRKTGAEHVTPMMYLPHDTDSDIIYVFATKGGAPSHPDWYHNLTAAGQATIERGTETQASPNTPAKPPESAPYPCSNSPAPSPHP